MSVSALGDVLDNGFGVWKNIIDQTEIYHLSYFNYTWDRPQRGHDINGVYYSKPAESIEWGNYWTDPLTENSTVLSMLNKLTQIAGQLLIEPVFYHSDVNVVMPGCKFVKPHVDTPHRFKPWNKPKQPILGVQMATLLQSNDRHAGTTAFLPKSHMSFWDIDKCYQGKYTNDFLRDAVQPSFEYGDLLVWDARTLHSQMPNTTQTARYMLLFNFVEKRILDKLVECENKS